MKRSEIEYLKVANDLIVAVEKQNKNPLSLSCNGYGLCHLAGKDSNGVGFIPTLSESALSEIKAEVIEDGGVSQYFYFHSRAHRIDYLLFKAAQNGEI